MHAQCSETQAKTIGSVQIMDMQIPPPSSLLISLLGMMGSVLYSMGKIMKKFYDSYILSYREKFIEQFSNLKTVFRLFLIFPINKM